MSFELRRATAGDVTFARELTCQNMLRYYIEFELPWQDHAFDVAWSERQNLLIVRDDVSVGYVSLSRDMRALYIRELQVSEGFIGKAPVPGRSIRLSTWRAESVVRLYA